MKSFKMNLSSNFNPKLVSELITELEKVGALRNGLNFTYEDELDSKVKKIFDKYSPSL